MRASCATMTTPRHIEAPPCRSSRCLSSGWRLSLSGWLDEPPEPTYCRGSGQCSGQCRRVTEQRRRRRLTTLHRRRSCWRTGRRCVTASSPWPYRRTPPSTLGQTPRPPASREQRMTAPAIPERMISFLADHSNCSVYRTDRFSCL